MANTAATFPLAWRLDDDVAENATDEDLREWAASQLKDTHEALDKLEAGALERQPPSFIDAWNPIGAVVAEAKSGMPSVWQYPQVVSSGVAKAGFLPGSLGWVAAIEALQGIQPPDEYQRLSSEFLPGWLFDAAIAGSFFVPGLGEVVAVLLLVTSAWRAVNQISETASAKHSSPHSTRRARRPSRTCRWQGSSSVRSSMWDSTCSLRVAL